MLRRAAPGIVLAALALLAGCHTAPPRTVIGPGADAPWPEQRAALEKLDRYGLNGRVAVAANGQGFSASLRYQQLPRGSNLALDGPLGIGGLRIVLEGEDLEIREFTQDGWRVSINTRAAGLGFSLPQRLTAEREGARLKLVVERWLP